ncbi:MAG: thiolase C-terminal domain-containing protein, partial [Candidatus Binatia bacterium]
MSLSGKTAIVGFGLTAYGKRGEFFERGDIVQIRECLDLALEDAGLSLSDVDGFSSYSVDANDPGLLAPSLGIPNVNFSSLVFGGGGGGTCAAIANAAAAVHAGLARVVLVWKIITQPPHARFGAAYGSPTVAANPYADFHRPYGL